LIGEASPRLALISDRGSKIAPNGMDLPSERGWVRVAGGVFVALVLGLLLLWVTRAAPARADATVNVNTTNAASTMGDGLCSLNEAVTYADGSAEPDCAPGTATGTTTINVPASATKYTVSPTLSITKNTVIHGDGASSTTIDGGGARQVVNVASTAQVTISGVTITGGVSAHDTTGCTGSGFMMSCPAEPGFDGGGIANAGSLALRDSVVTGNQASAGQAGFPGLIILGFPQHGQDAGHGGNGGGIYNSGQLVISGSTISGNAAGAGGSGTSGVSGTSTTSPGQGGGSGGFGGSGGGLLNDVGATATITDSTITGNSAGNGGNAGNGSAATAASSNGGSAGFPGFGGDGGAIENRGTLTLAGSTLSANKTGVGGNGGTFGAATAGGSNGTSTPSSAGGHGGAMDNETSQSATLSDDTIVNNTASAGGTGGSANGSPGTAGGIQQEGIGLAALTFVTVAGNHAAGTGGGLNRIGGGTITEADSIVASNTGSPAKNCSGTIVDDNFNLVFGDNSCPGTAADPKLGSLASNGGPTQTLALQTGSAAIDEVPIMNCPVHTDQRGINRPQGTVCDAGSYEFAPPSVGGATGTGNTTTTASVTASINPNLRDTTVVVSYGVTPGYGSATAPQDVGAGNSPTTVNAPLTGLVPNTTYHARVVATNGDGTTNSADFTFKTPPGVAASVVSASPPEAGSR
jgi:hypothetical protein